MKAILSYINCFVSLILSGLLVYTFTINWWKLDNGKNVDYQSLINCYKIGNLGTIEIVKALFYGVLITNMILIYVTLKFETYYLYLIPFLANVASMILITVVIPPTKGLEYQEGFIIGWAIVSIEFITFLTNLIMISFYGYKKRRTYQEIV
jgi:hypothetical protein